MKKKCTLVLSHLAFFLEMVITVMLVIGIGLLCIRMAFSLFHIMDGDPFEAYEELLSFSLNLIIGVELIRMMYYHTTDMVFELLVFALARQVIIDHSSTVTSLIGVCAIAVLFAIKKYLFTSHTLSDESENLTEKEDK